MEAVACFSEASDAHFRRAEADLVDATEPTAFSPIPIPLIRSGAGISAPGWSFTECTEITAALGSAPKTRASGRFSAPGRSP